MGNALRVGVVGVGRIGVHHARSLLAVADVAELVVADADPARAEIVARELGASAAAPAALIESAPDALVISTPTPTHAPLLRLAAEAGIPTFCEKPVALELAVLDDVAAEVEATGTLVQVGFQRRFDAGYRAARDAVADGRVGRLLVLRAATHDPAPPAEAYVAASGGIFRDLHIHDFDAIRFVTGREVVEVYADGAVRETPWFARHDDVDAAVATLRLDDGALAVVTGTRRDPLGYDVRLEVFGTGDSVAVGVDERSPYRSVEQGQAPPADPYRGFLDRFDAAYRAELEAFVAAVRSGGPSPCTLADARAALAIAVAADRSRAERRPVAVEEVGPAQIVRAVGPGL
ncbi:MAG TPA: Gfo/Idh/MocA family oxidoreductase [Gaiellaceae bacterium]